MSRFDALTKAEKEIISYTNQHIVDALFEDGVTDLFINPDNRVFVKSHTAYKEIEPYTSNLFVFINAIAEHSGVVVNVETPILETTFAGMRVTAEIPPISIRPSITFRIPNPFVLSLESYLEKEQVNQKQYDYILSAITQRKNILVVGQTGSGKTTFANAITKKISEMNQDERILILEDTDEIVCDNPNFKKLLTSVHVGMNDLLKVSLRESPDRIFVGEVRDKAALEMLKAWNTGHPGGVATAHANGSEEGLQRLIDCAMEAGVPAPYALVKFTVNVILFMGTVFTESNGYERRLREMAEVVDFDSKAQKFVLKQII